MPILSLLIFTGAAGMLLNKVKLPRKEKKTALPRKKQKATKKNTLMSPVEAEAASQQKIALSALGLTSLGTFTAPVIALVGLPLLIYNYFYMIRKIRESYVRRNKLTVLIYDALTVSLTLIMGFFVTTSLLFAALFTTNRLIAKTEREAQTDFSHIFGELSDTVWLLQNGIEFEVPLNSVQPQDIIVVHAGDMIPVDGHIAKGEGIVDQHLLTGEAQPVEKKAGSKVFASTLLVSGIVQVVVEKQGMETVTGQIAQTLEHATTFKHQVQSRGDLIVEKGALLTMLTSAAALPLLGLNGAMALNYSGFGYQMRMAAPLMVLNYLRIASRNGILVKDGRALDILHQVDTVVFDKTGTLTEETPQIERLLPCVGFSEMQLLQYAASAEYRQKHPIAQAICSHARQQGLSLLEIVHTDYAIGHGLRVDLFDQHHEQLPRTILIGSKRFIHMSDIEIPENINALQVRADEKGHSIVYVASDSGELIGAIELRPTLRPQAHDAVRVLRELGITLYIISGDQEKPTRHLAESLGIDHYFSETLPQDKARHIETLQAKGHKVCFIGDGINDSIALQTADVSVSLHGAATIAQDTAEIVLMTPDLLHLPYLISLARELHQQMDRSEWMNTASGVACVSGVLLLGMGLSGAIALYCGGLLVNISNAMLPLLTHPKKPQENSLTVS